MSDLKKEIETALNKHSAEKGSDTPDFILAAYLMDCLKAFDRATRVRSKWHGYAPLHANNISEKS